MDVSGTNSKRTGIRLRLQPRLSNMISRFVPERWRHLLGSGFRSNRLSLSHILYFFSDSVMYFLGPILICLALGIIGILAHTFFYILVPWMRTFMPAWRVYLHIAWVLFILVHILCNYYWCVRMQNNGPLYQSIVRELADATGFVYPETAEELQHWKDQFECRIMARRRRIRRRESEERNNNNNESNRPLPSPQPIRSWQLVGPREWAYCNQSNLPKPPRSHFDHVTKNLVLNMDHYCPWMFNTVGFLNYRFFVNFLIYVTLGLTYGTYILYRPFMAFHWVARTNRYTQQQTDPSAFKPSASEELSISFSFMICAAVGLAVMFLLSFHLHLVFTAQTTIEFHGNLYQTRRARLRGSRFLNPYDLGFHRNFQQLWGTRSILLIFLIPSPSEPEFLPVPLPGDLGCRHPKSKESVPQTQDSSSKKRETMNSTLITSTENSVINRSCRKVQSDNADNTVNIV